MGVGTMDWVIIMLILTSAPNFTESHSHYLASFASEKLCKDVATAFERDLGKPSETGIKADVRAVVLNANKMV
jgi:hypothetical protein